MPATTGFPERDGIIARLVKDVRRLQRMSLNTLRDVDPTGISQGAIPVWDGVSKYVVGGINGTATQQFGARDRYVISNATTADYPLTYTPGENTLNLFLNRQALDEGVDYTVDYTAPKVTLTASATRAVNDVLWARYLTGSPLAANLPTTLIWGIRSDSAQIIGTIDAVALIDPAVAFTDIQADLDPGSGEICLVFGCSSFFDASTACDYLFLRVGNTPGLWHFVRTEPGPADSDNLIETISSLTGAGTYQVTASGSTVTVKKNGVTQATIALAGSDATALSRSIVGVRGTHGTLITMNNFSAAAGTVSDPFTRPDADQLGTAPTGQTWVGTS